MSENRQLNVERPLYGGRFSTSDPHIALPFVLPKEVVEVAPEGQLLSVLKSASERVPPRCPHFGACGGCQYQMASDRKQLALKRDILHAELQKASIAFPGNIQTHSAESYGYRNRIRLRIERIAGVLRFGYNIRATTDFLPINVCPISVPVLIATVEALLALAAEDRDARHWLNATAEAELFVNDDLSRIQLTLFCAPRTKAPQGSFARMMSALQLRVPQVVGAAAVAFDPRTGPTGRVLAEHGASGLNYKVSVAEEQAETYWISRGGFFQVNRFLIGKLIQLVCEGRSGAIAWDLFAGVGLFSRVLAKNFAQVTAVESNPAAAADLAAALRRLGPQHRAVQQTTLDFLHEAITQRERPELVVLDPPRAGAGLEVCAQLARIAARQIVYVSCDPTTSARDLAALQASGYHIAALHLIDLFPQTFHIETVAILTRET